MKTRTGFTLNELIVVFAIIAVIAAILLPVFAKAIEGEKAKQAQCISNLKKIGLAFKQYTQDWDGKYQEIYYRVDSTTYTGFRCDWPDKLNPYISSPAIWKCPSDSTAPRPPKSPTVCSYGANNNLSRFSFATIISPAITVTLYEDSSSWKYTNCANYESGFYGSVIPNQHSRGDNYLLCDGHVRWLKDYVLGHVSGVIVNPWNGYTFTP